MFGFITYIPRRLKHLLSKFKPYFSKPQYKNFSRTQLGIITTAKGEHDIKKYKPTIHKQKNQSSQTEMSCYNHFSTMGTVLSHNYVTSLYFNDEFAVSDGLKLYGNKKK